MDAIYDKIGVGYDTTRRADPKITDLIAGLLPIKNNGHYVDMACGTGNYTSALAEKGGRWEAFDQSETMLNEAGTKSSQVVWRKMDAMCIDYPPATFDGATCTLAIHHFPQIRKPFCEIARVLKPGGSFVLFTAFPSQMQRYWLLEYFPQMIANSCQQMPDQITIETALSEAGLLVEEIRPFDVTSDLEDFFLYSGKQRPEIYLSEAVRAGISSFHSGLCPLSELESGLAKLKEHIESGEIVSVMSSYEHSAGDYVFIQAVKR